MRTIFSFPNPVNEKAARVVAGAVLATALVILASGCKLFGLLARAGLVPDAVCAECAAIGSRLSTAR